MTILQKETLRSEIGAQHPLISKLSTHLGIPLDAHSFFQGAEGGAIVFSPSDSMLETIGKLGVEKYDHAVSQAASELGWKIEITPVNHSIRVFPSFASGRER